jgi:UDP-N-acetylmuramoyl-L-alanyl-D-glutamate--2,6-diaminopimelate ligase
MKNLSDSTQSPLVTLAALIRNTTVVSVTGNGEIPIRGISCDSNSVMEGDLFFVLPGTKVNGSHYVHDAIAHGAVAVVTGEDLPGIHVPLVRVPVAQEALADLATAFYGHPSSSLAVAGVTGTNGKTTTAWIIRHLCDTVGRPCGLVGTIKYILPGIVEDASRTTPGAIELQRMLATMRDGGFRAAALEVSSHALVQQRVRGVEFDAAILQI